MASALERAARAAFSADRCVWPLEDVLEDYKAIARAVLMAVRGEAPTKAMAESRASDDEGEFAPMLDLIDFSGENKTRTVLRQAWIDGIDAILNEKE